MKTRPQNEFWLAVDLSSPLGSLALYRKENPQPSFCGELTFDTPYKHSENVISGIDDLLNASGGKLAQVTRFFCPAGPGSFTGLRIALATVKGFAFSNGSEIVTLSGSEGRAHAWLTENTKVAVGDGIIVLTHVGSKKMVEAVFEVNARREAGLEGENAVEIDAWKTPSGTKNFWILSDRPAEGSIEFPNHARQLVPASGSSRTIRVARTLEEIIPLSPEYYGSR